MAFNLPPGCSVSDIPGNRPEDDFCPVCFQNVDMCMCHKCPACGEVGRPECYKERGLQLTKQQAIARAKQKIEDLEDDIADGQRYIEWLEDQDDDYQVEFDEI